MTGRWASLGVSCLFGVVVLAGSAHAQFLPASSSVVSSFSGQFILLGTAEARVSDVEQRLDWIRSQYWHSDPDPDWHGFATQPYEQLAAVYRQAGQDTQARKVAIARHADLRKYGNLNRYRKFGNWFLDKTIKYGYQTWRPPVAGLAVLYCAFWLLTTVVQHTHAIVPVGNIEGLNPVPSATTCASNYPCFVPAGYAVDVVVPLINVHQAQYWGPNGQAWGYAWVTVTWVATVLGWALATFLVAGLAGLTRRQG